jgi:hypothetical protein
MRKNPKARKLAARILTLCKDGDGRIDPDKVAEALSALRSEPPRDHRAVLRYLAFLAEREIAASTARVSSGAELSQESLRRIETEFSRRYGRKLGVETRTDPSLIAGTRVQVGDDVHEISIPSRLGALGSGRS